MGLQRDKDVAGFVAPLKSIVTQFFPVSLPPPRGLSSDELAQAIGPRQCHAVDSVALGCALARARTGPSDRVLVCGSFQIVGPALGWLGLYSRRHNQSR